MPSAADAAQRWAQNFGSSGAKYQAGVEGVAVAPGALAARAKALWLANTQAAGDRFAANSAKVTREAWIAQTVAKGVPRLASGAAAAQSKTEAAFAKLFPAIANAVNSLPARGDIEMNITRSGAFARAMHKYKTGG